MINHPRIIEIVGLAGTGKSTLVKCMRQRNPEIRVFPLPKTWILWSLMKRSFLWMPLWLQSLQRRNGFTREELISIGCIDAWLTYLQRRTSVGTATAVLDPGSVYWLTKLQGLTSRSAYQRWWEHKFEQWALGLDVIVWLDAPEELCLQRALAREEGHPAKRMTQQRVLERFRALRASYERIISKMAARHPKQVFYFRTDRIPTEQIIDQVFSGVNFASHSAISSDQTNSSQETSDSAAQPTINNSAMRI